MINDEEKPDNASLWKMRLTLLLIGVLFVIVGSLAPEDGRRWIGKEITTPRGPRLSEEAKARKIYHDEPQQKLVMKYAAFAVGCGLIYFSLRKPPPVDRDKFRSWLRKKYWERRP